MTQKIDIINNAYSELRIAGLVIQASGESLRKALNRLESMASEFYGRNMCIGYNFEEEPSVDDELGVQQEHHHMLETNLAVRMIPDFNKEDVSQTLFNQASQSFKASAAICAREKLKEVQYPSRQPRGSGNRRLNRFRHFYPESTPLKTSCSNVTMMVGDVRDMFSEFKAFLRDETIASYIVEATDGVTVVSDDQTATRVLYRVQATEEGSDRIKITITTSSGRVKSRFRNIEVISSEI